MESELSLVIDLLQRSYDENKIALQLVRLEDGYQYELPPSFKPNDSKKDKVGKSKLKDDMTSLVYFAAAANKLELDCIEKIARLGLSYCLYTYECLTDNKRRSSFVLNGSDVAEDVLLLIQDMCQTVDMLRKVEDLEAKRRLEEGDSFGEKDEDDGSKGGEEEEEGDSFGEKDEDDGSQGGEEEDTDDEDAGSEEGSENEHEGDEDKEHDNSEEKTPTKEDRKRYTDESHHLNRRCMVPKGCNGYTGPNLKRHLERVHYQKGQISEADIGRYFAMGVNPKKKRGPSRVIRDGKKTKGRWRRWCPHQACNYLGCYLPQHLQNAHRMKPSSALYKLSLKVARRYKGLDELEDMDKWPKQTTIQELTAPSPRPPLPSLPKKLSPSFQERTVMQSSPVPGEMSPSRGNSELQNEPDIVPPTPVTKSQHEKQSPSQPTPGSTAKSSDEKSDDNDTEDESDTIYPMQEDYFTDPNPKSNRQKWLIGFYNYLYTPSAGFHKARNRLQHASQVKTILNDIDPKGLDITVLVEEEANRVWLDWVVPNLKQKAGGTLTSYMGSLQKFLEFATKKGSRPNLPALSDEIKDALSDLCKDLKGWKHTIRKETSKDRWQKYLNECDTRLTSAEVDAIMNSEPALKGRHAFTAAQSGHQLTSTQYCAARDLLIMQCTKAVGPRPGPLENATLETFQTAKWDADKRKKVMLVAPHKREQDGPAPLAMDSELAFLMEVFINKIRPVITSDTSPESKIFLKADGDPFPKGTIGKRISAFVVKSGVRPDSNISATDFRKWIVTTMYIKKKQGRNVDDELLRRVMCHSDKTAKTWYLRHSLTEQAAEAADQIDQLTKPSPKKRRPTPEREEHEEDHQSPRKKTLTEAENEAVKEAFQTEIKNNTALTKGDLIAKMETHSVLRVVVNDTSKVKKISDRYRYLKQAEKRIDPHELPVESPQTRTAAFVYDTVNAPSESGPGYYEATRVDWSAEDTATIEEALQKFEMCPRNHETKLLFQTTPELQAIYNSNSFNRIRNKVKNIMRKKVMANND